MTHITIVEDEPNISEVVSLYLKRAGYTVSAYADGKLASEAFTRQLPDLVILDVMLPGMDGFALTRQLRDRSDVPIILLTSRREEADRIAGLGAGRRRLRGQTLQPAGAGQPGAGCFAPDTLSPRNQSPTAC